MHRFSALHWRCKTVINEKIAGLIVINLRSSQGKEAGSRAAL